MEEYKSLMASNGRQESIGIVESDEEELSMVLERQHEESGLDEGSEAGGYRFDISQGNELMKVSGVTDTLFMLLKDSGDSRDGSALYGTV